MDEIIIIIDGYLFDVTEFSNSHPGGKRLLQKYHYKDATKDFNSIKGHSDAHALSILDKCCIGKAEVPPKN